MQRPRPRATRPAPRRSAPIAAHLAVVLFGLPAALTAQPAAAADAAAKRVAPAPTAAATLPETIRRGGEPSGTDDLRAMQHHVQALLAEVLPATIALGGASGVIVEGGYVLTAAHVTRSKGRKVQMTLHDGRRIEGVTLGMNHRTDAGLVRITTAGELPFRPLGRSAELRRGQWCVMLGHPSGPKPGRAAPARLGRVLAVPANGYLVTDCTMQSGDSGGPLFDMDGNVIGINSRINGDLAQNMHVPIDAFRASWDALVAGEVIEAPQRRSRLGFGATLDYQGPHPRVTAIADGSAAAEAGLAAGDVVLRVADREVTDRRSLARALGRRAVGDQVAVRVQRGDETLDLQIELQREGRR